MRKLLLKTISLIAFLTIVTGTAIAFLSNTEASADNSFIAGTIDLKIDSECHYNEEPCDGFGSWDLTDLTTEKFFNFFDLELQPL